MQATNFCITKPKNKCQQSLKKTWNEHPKNGLLPWIFIEAHHPNHQTSTFSIKAKMELRETVLASDVHEAAAIFFLVSYNWYFIVPIESMYGIYLHLPWI